MNERKDPATGTVSFEQKTGDLGLATVGGADRTLVLRCAKGDELLMEIAIRCLEGEGDYEVPAGDLVLGGKRSDRTCRVSVDLDASRVRGFIDCPKEPEDHDNVFANSGPPMGLGHFDLPRE